jgi:hypothetical protein
MTPYYWQVVSSLVARNIKKKFQNQNIGQASLPTLPIIRYKSAIRKLSGIFAFFNGCYFLNPSFVPSSAEFGA